MILKSLKLRNIRSYVNESIDFDSGITLLSGDIGAGKTTLLLSIEFALFGLIKGEISGDVLLRHGTKDGEVELNILVDNKDVIIKRVLKRRSVGIGQDSGYVIVNGVKTEMAAEELKTFVLETFGYPKQMLKRGKNELFRFTIYTPQEDMKQILYEDDEKRLQTLRRIFQIEKYKTVKDNATIILKDIKQQIKFLNEQSENFNDLSEESQNIKKQETELKIQLGLRKKQKDEITIQINEIKEKQKANENKIEKFKQSQSEVKIKESEINHNKESQTQLKEKLNSLKEKVELTKSQYLEIKLPESNFNLEELSKKSKTIQEKIEEVSKFQNEFKEKIKSRELRLKESNDEILRLKKELSALPLLKEEVDKLEKTINKDVKKTLDEKRALNQENILKENKNKLLLTELKKKSELVLDDHCPTCDQDISKEHKDNLTLKYSETKTKLEEELLVLSSKKLETEKEIKILEETIEKSKLSELKIAEMKTKINLLVLQNSKVEEKENLLKGVQLEISKIKEESKKFNLININELKEQLEEVTKQITNSKAIEEKRKQKKLLKTQYEELILEHKLSMKKLVELKEKLTLLTDLVLKLNKTLEGSDLITKLKEELVEKLNELLTREKQISEAFTIFKTQLTNLEKDKERILKEEKKRKKMKEEIAKTKNLRQWFEEYFIPLNDDIEKHVMLTVYSEFNQLFVEWFQMLIEDEGIEARLDETFSPVITQNGYESKVYNLSGGEKTSLALAYRLALNKVINNLVTDIKTKDILILDEPTDGFSSDQLDNVRNVLEELGIKQIIIVSHETKIESFAENMIYISKQDGRSKILKSILS
jgi:DNA repair protein SbcC/Rad50